MTEGGAEGVRPGAVVEFVFGLGSRYSYLASTQLDRVAGDCRCRFEWTPLSSVELMAACGRTPFGATPVSGQYEWEYRRRDALDWADYYGVPYQEPNPPPQDHQLMAIACRAAGEQGALVEYAKGLFAAVFVKHETIDTHACAVVAKELKLDVARFRRDLEDPAIRARVSGDARRCARRGAFGVPTFFVGERMFWGNDRLVILEHVLRKGRVAHG